MGGKFAVGVGAFRAAKPQARITDVINRLHLFRADLFLDPKELAIPCEILDQFFGFQVWEDNCKLLGRLLRINQMGSFNVQ